MSGNSNSDPLWPVLIPTPCLLPWSSALAAPSRLLAALPLRLSMARIAVALGQPRADQATPPLLPQAVALPGDQQGPATGTQLGPATGTGNGPATGTQLGPAMATQRIPRAADASAASGRVVGWTGREGADRSGDGATADPIRSAVGGGSVCRSGPGRPGSATRSERRTGLRT